MPFDSESARKAGKKSSRKGIPNKDVSKVREAIHELLVDNSGKLGEWLEKVADDSPKEALKIFDNLSEYALPKLSRTEVDAIVEEKESIDPSKLSDDELELLEKLMSKASE